MRDIVDSEHVQSAAQIREILATHKEAEDLINIGAYVAGSNAKIDYAISRIDAVNDFLRQGMDERDDLVGTVEAMHKLVLDRRAERRTS
jgi:flagellum-specific ATP synthase